MKDLAMSMFANRQDYEAAVAAQKAMTPHDELMALAGKWAEPTPQDDCTLYTMGQRTGRNQCASDLRALLDSDAFRAMVRDAERLDWLEANGESVNLCSRVVGGYREFRDPIGVSRAAIDAAASGAGGSGG